MSSTAFRNLLENGDVDGIVAAWATLFPGAPLPHNREQAEISMHRARTEANSITLRSRAWSHSWLSERGIPSNLPESLRPKAEQMFISAIPSVGISVNMRSEWMKPAANEVRGAMEHAVLDAYADGRHDDTSFVKSRMMDAKAKTMKLLFGGVPK